MLVASPVFLYSSGVGLLRLAISFSSQYHWPCIVVRVHKLWVVGELLDVVMLAVAVHLQQLSCSGVFATSYGFRNHMLLVLSVWSYRAGTPRCQLSTAY
jgi:hypothetical protein